MDQCILRTDRYKIDMPCSEPTMFCLRITKSYREGFLPEVKVFLYKAKDLYDDRFAEFESRHVDKEILHVTSDIIAFDLALAQKWPRNEMNTSDGTLFMKQANLKPGTYVYLYRVEGEFQLGKEENVTELGTRRKVHFVSVGRKNQYNSLLSDFSKLEFGPNLMQGRKTNNNNNIARACQLSLEDIRAFTSIRDYYDLKNTMHAGRLAPLERTVWKRVFEAVVTKFD